MFGYLHHCLLYYKYRCQFGAPISIVISLLTFIATIAILIRRRRYLNSPDWLLTQSKRQHQAATQTAARAAREAAAQIEWQAAQAAAQEAQQAAFKAAAETAKEAAARKEWQAAQSGAETPQAAANTWPPQKSSANSFNDMYVQKSRATLGKETAWLVAKIGLKAGLAFLMIYMVTVLPPGTTVILAIAILGLVLYFLPTLILMRHGLPWGVTLVLNVLFGWTAIGWAVLGFLSLKDVWQADGDTRQSARIAESEARILAEMRKQSQKSETF